jgi:hypothetical protein
MQNTIEKSCGCLGITYSDTVPENNPYSMLDFPPHICNVMK